MTTTTKTKVSPALVDAMVKFYGTIEAAREAYRTLKADMPRRCDTLWVASSGRIQAVTGTDVIYRGSPDAWRTLP